jgi:hypothetical protein
MPIYERQEKAAMSEKTELSKEQIDNLFEQWKSTLELRNDQFNAFDKSILYASGGALAISIANLDKFGLEKSPVGWMLILSWLAFAASLVANIISYWTATNDMERELRKIKVAIESATDHIAGNLWKNTTVLLNFLALALFCSGITLMCAFVYNTFGG